MKPEFADGVYRPSANFMGHDLNHFGVLHFTKEKLPLEFNRIKALREFGLDEKIKFYEKFRSFVDSQQNESIRDALELFYFFQTHESQRYEVDEGSIFTKNRFVGATAKLDSPFQLLNFMYKRNLQPSNIIISNHREGFFRINKNTLKVVHDAEKMYYDFLKNALPEDWQSMKIFFNRP